jgi:histidinol-phosphatase (PHP family)
MHDYHVHSRYSDGEFLGRMVRAARDAGLDGVGFADHCNVSEREQQQRRKFRMGFNLDVTYSRRRQAIQQLRSDYDLAIYEAVEMDYDPRDEAAIATFLDEAEFDYAIGSVHYLDGIHVQDEAHFRATSENEREALVDQYVDKLVALLDSELFEIAAHVDLFERNEALRGMATEAHYHRILDALESSRTILELNAGRRLRAYGKYHPRPGFREFLEANGVSFTLGSDAHTPQELRDRAALFESFEFDDGPVRIDPTT